MNHNFHEAIIKNLFYKKMWTCDELVMDFNSSHLKTKQWIKYTLIHVRYMVILINKADRQMYT